MNIYEIKAVASGDDIQEKVYIEELVFSPNSKPVIKNINTVSSVDEEENFYGNLPEGTAIQGYFGEDSETGEIGWSVEAFNTKQQSTLQQIELPTVDLEDIVFIPQKMVAGDMPVILNESYADKIQYEYEEVSE